MEERRRKEVMNEKALCVKRKMKKKIYKTCRSVKERKK